MADLLSHVLIAYVLLTVTSWWVESLTPRWVVIGMGGAIIPDLSKVRLLVDPETIERALGVPFTYGHVDTLGGVLVAAGVVTLLFERRHWRRVYGLLVAGGLAHLVVDGLRVWADGRASQWLFPALPGWRPPTPGLYVTSNPMVPVVVLGVAAAVFAVDWRRRTRDESADS